MIPILTHWHIIFLVFLHQNIYFLKDLTTIFFFFSFFFFQKPKGWICFIVFTLTAVLVIPYFLEHKTQCALCYHSACSWWLTVYAASRLIYIKVTFGVKTKDWICIEQNLDYRRWWICVDKNAEINSPNLMIVKTVRPEQLNKLLHNSMKTMKTWEKVYCKWNPSSTNWIL